MVDEQLELAAATRQLIDAVRRVRTDNTSMAAAAQLVTDAYALLVDDLSEGPFMQAGLDLELGRPPSVATTVAGDLFPYSPAVGPRNPISPSISMSTTDGVTTGSMRLRAAHNGPPGAVHGGVVALIMDELLGVTAVQAGLGGYTGTLSVRYNSPTPLEKELQLWSVVDRTEGRKVFVSGEIRDGDTVTARAEGIFIQAREQTEVKTRFDT